MPDFRVLCLATDELACIFETDTGFLRKIVHGETEIVRAVYAAVRDENWNTVEPDIEVRTLRVEQNGFQVDFDALCQAAGICFCWSGSIEAHGPKLTFTFKGEARSSFRKNRIGLCVLHPIRECAALPCLIQDTCGKWSEAFFPGYISPHQPFKDFRGLHWSPRPGVEAELLFQGDIFETEDQRNWTDASFKTYCTPLAHPFPVLIEAGTKLYQQVALDLKSGEPVHHAESKIPEIRLEKLDGEVPMPRLGLGMASHGCRLSQIQLQRLKEASAKSFAGRPPARPRRLGQRLQTCGRRSGRYRRSTTGGVVCQRQRAPGISRVLAPDGPGNCLFVPDFS